MKTLPFISNTNYRNEFLAQCDQTTLAQAKAGDQAAKDKLQQEFEAYQKAKSEEAKLELQVLSAANLAEFKANPDATIAAIKDKANSSFYDYEIAANYGLFTVVREQWKRDAGTQFPMGSDLKGKVATKEWKATIRISDRDYEIEGSSYYAPAQRHEAVLNAAWKTLLRTVGKA